MADTFKQLASGIREFEVLVRLNAEIRRVCKLAFSNKDASIYLIPYAPGGSYYFGGESLPEQKLSRTFDFQEQQSSQTVPKISIHQSGRVHIRTARQEAGPLIIPALDRLCGEHVASVSVDRFDALLTLKTAPRTSDALIRVLDGAVSGRFAIYVNGREPKFKSSNVKLYVRLTRQCLSTPLYIGIAPIGQNPIADPKCKQGVTIICGWDPFKSTKFLYLRGQ
jgi:hypothetical protein